MKEWGNSAALRIPASVLEAAHVRVDQAVNVRETYGKEGGRIVIEPVHPARYTLGTIVVGISDEKIHEPVEMDHLWPRAVVKGGAGRERR